jgi:hypothetical protein
LSGVRRADAASCAQPPQSNQSGRGGERRFCVNTLGDGGAEIADIFAGRTGKRPIALRAGMDHAVDRQPRPSAVIAFDCRIVE